VEVRVFVPSALITRCGVGWYSPPLMTRSMSPAPRQRGHCHRVSVDSPTRNNPLRVGRHNGNEQLCQHNDKEREARGGRRTDVAHEGPLDRLGVDPLPLRILHLPRTAWSRVVVVPFSNLHTHRASLHAFAAVHMRHFIREKVRVLEQEYLERCDAQLLVHDGQHAIVRVLAAGQLHAAVDLVVPLPRRGVKAAEATVALAWAHKVDKSTSGRATQRRSPVDMTWFTAAA